jgi:hypothetical protein
MSTQLDNHHTSGYCGMTKMLDDRWRTTTRHRWTHPLLGVRVGALLLQIPGLLKVCFHALSNLIIDFCGNKSCSRNIWKWEKYVIAEKESLVWFEIWRNYIIKMIRNCVPKENKICSYAPRDYKWFDLCTNTNTNTKAEISFCVWWQR